MRKLFVSICLLSAGLFSSDQIPAPDQKTPILLTNGTVHPVSQPSFEGSILFENGKFTKMGPEILTSPETEVWDISGMHVYPGLIAAGTTIGLVEISAVRATADNAETGWLNPNVRAERAYNPDSESIPVTRSNGVLLAHVTPQGGRVSGTSAVMQLDGWTWEDCILRTPIGIHVNWPSMKIEKSRHPKPDQEKENQRDVQMKQLDDMMEDARAYLSTLENNTLKGTDQRWEAMIPILRKEIPFFIHANRILQIQAAVEWCNRQDVNMILVGGGDSWRTTDLLKDNHIPVIFEHPLSTPMRRDESTDAKYGVPSMLFENGIKFCVSASAGTFEASHQRNVPYEAAMAAAYGLPRDEALKSVTLYAAEILGIDDQVGSLDVGKDATLIITDGDPLEITTHVEIAFIQGRLIDLNDRHKTLYEKYQQKYLQKQSD